MAIGLFTLIDSREVQSSVASTHASRTNLISTSANHVVSRGEQQQQQHLVSESSQRKGRWHKYVKGKASAEFISAVALLQSMPSAYGKQSDMMTLQVRSTPTSSDGVHIAHNLPIQLVIIFGTIILFAMFVTALACLFRSSSSRTGSKSARGSFSDDGEDVTGKRNSWSPGGPNSIYIFGEESMNHSKDSLSPTKEGRNSRRAGGSGPFSPMPALKDHHYQEEIEEKRAFYSLPRLSIGQAPSVTMPASVAMSPRVRGNGWQLYDNPMPYPVGSRGDVEAAGLGPTRRPSFIDRLLAHRADPNDVRLPNGQLAADNSVAGPRIPSNRKVSGSAILSALNPLRTRDISQKRLSLVESDYEESIGGRDGEIPMAKRILDNRERFAFDEATIAAASPAVHRQSIDRFSPLPQRFFSGRRATLTPRTPRSPGLAGLGATWNQIEIMSAREDENDEKIDCHGRVPTFAELQRIAVSSADAHRWKMQSTIDQWVQASRFAGGPPPSRKGSSASFLTVGGASQFTVTGLSSKPSDEAIGVSRVPSFRPHFHPTTKLASWVRQDADVIDEQSEGHGRTDEASEKASSIVEKHLVCGNEASIDADHNRNRGMLCEAQGQEVIVTSPPFHHSEIKQLSSNSSIDGTMGHTYGQVIVSEEVRRRQQKHLDKEKRRGERRAASRQHSRQSEEIGVALGGDDEQQQQQQQDFILRIDECREKQQHHHHHFDRLRPDLDAIVAQSRKSSTRVILSSRSASRQLATPLSPPESPLTSASEGPSTSPRRRSEHFLVPSSRSRSSIHSGS